MAIAEALAPLGKKQLLQKDLSLLPARLALGSSMLYHGFTKLATEGPAKTGEQFEQMGIRPGRFWGTATGVAELFAGVSTVAGFGTRIAALAVLVTQGVAVAKVHARRGFAISRGGFEFNLALMAVAAGLLIAGPGRVSAHELAERRLQGRGPRRLLRRARPSGLLRAILLLK